MLNVRLLRSKYTFQYLWAKTYNISNVTLPTWCFLAVNFQHKWYIQDKTFSDFCNLTFCYQHKKTITIRYWIIKKSSQNGKVYFLATETIIDKHYQAKLRTLLYHQYIYCTIQFSSYSSKTNSFFSTKSISTLWTQLMLIMNMINEYSCNLIGLARF